MCMSLVLGMEGELTRINEQEREREEQNCAAASLMYSLSPLNELFTQGILSFF